MLFLFHVLFKSPDRGPCISFSFITLGVKDYTKHSGCFLWQTGPSIDVLRFQAKRGFALLEEDSLLELLQHRKAPIPDEAKCAGDPKLELTLTAISSVLPATTLEEAMQYCQVGSPPPQNVFCVLQENNNVVRFCFSSWVFQLVAYLFIVIDLL